jgi:hypothetical protein
MFYYKLVRARKASIITESYSGGNSLLLNLHRLQTLDSTLYLDFNLIQGREKYFLHIKTQSSTPINICTYNIT